jgi:hypothetical protein
MTFFGGNTFPIDILTSGDLTCIITSQLLQLLNDNRYGKLDKKNNDF